MTLQKKERLCLPFEEASESTGSQTLMEPPTTPFRPLRCLVANVDAAFDDASDAAKQSTAPKMLLPSIPKQKLFFNDPLPS